MYTNNINQRGDDREAEGNALLMRRMATPYRGFESLSLRKIFTTKTRRKSLEFKLGLVGFEPTTPCVGNTDSKSTELQALLKKHSSCFNLNLFSEYVFPKKTFLGASPSPKISVWVLRRFWGKIKNDLSFLTNFGLQYNWLEPVE